MLHYAIWYLLIGAALAFMSNLHMVDSGKSRQYKIKVTLGLLIGWPIMIGYLVILVGFFLLFGGSTL